MKSTKVWLFKLPWRIELWSSRKVTSCSFPPWLLITMTHVSQSPLFFFLFFFHSPLYDYFLYTTAGEKAVKKFPLLPLPSLPCSHLFMYLMPHWFLKLDRCKTWDKSETIRNDFFDYLYFIVVSYFCAL